MTRLVIELSLPGLPPRASAHWRTLHAAKKAWERDLGWQMLAQRCASLTLPERRRVVIEFHHPGRMMDKDNRYARCKVPLDVLSRATGRKVIGLGLIWDDAPEYADVHAECVRAKVSRTVIRVYECS